MGYQFFEKKKERDQRLREIQLRESLAQREDLFAAHPEAYAVRYSFDVCGKAAAHIKTGMSVLLAADDGSVTVWKNGKLGTLCEEDAQDALELLSQVANGMCLAEILSASDEFNTCTLKLIPIHKDRSDSKSTKAIGLRSRNPKE